MDIKNFILSYYQNSAKNFHIQRVAHTLEAQKPHTHEYFQIYYVSQGHLTHFVGDNFSVLAHGDMFIIPPGTVHHISMEQDTIFFSVSFMPEFLGGINDSNRLAVTFLRNLNVNNEILPKVTIDSEDILYTETLLSRMLMEFTLKKIGFGEILYAHTVLLVTTLGRNYFKKDRSHISDYFENNKQFVLHCISYVENHFADSISLDEISRRSTMSKSSFCALFSRLTGHSFNNYLNLCRIKKAAEYIKSGYKITAVYGLCGYNDFSTFYRNFKKAMGMSPQEYKRKNCN